MFKFVHPCNIAVLTVRLPVSTEYRSHVRTCNKKSNVPINERVKRFGVTILAVELQ